MDYKYYQLLDNDYNYLIPNNENPANICDGEDGRTARRLAREWMKANGVKCAQLIQNVIKENGGDNISWISEITIK